MSTTAPRSAARRLDLPGDLAALVADPGVPFGHDLKAAPPFDVATLAGVCARVPAAWIVALGVQTDPGASRCDAPRHPDPVGAVRGDATAPGYVAVAHLDLLGEFGAPARALAAEVRAWVGPAEGGVTRVELGALVAPPGSVVPAHADEHHNLLLQVSGTKTVWIDTEPDRRRRDARVHAHYADPTVPVDLPPAVAVHLAPGTGVYVPPDRFHWVEVGDDRSVGVSVGVATARTRAVVDARRFDRALGRWGLPARGRAHPGGPGTALKAGLVRSLHPRD